MKDELRKTNDTKTYPTDLVFTQSMHSNAFGAGSFPIGGLTKREYFAAAAMQSNLVMSRFSDLPNDLATFSVQVADALIAKLNEGKTD